MEKANYDKPLPIAQPESDFFWEKARSHELWLRRCNECERSYFYPRDICPLCFSRDTGWAKSAGIGTLYTFSVVHRAPHPSFKDDVPYVAAVVEVDGARIPSNLIGIDPDPGVIRVGMALQVVFEDITEEVTLPKFKPLTE